MILKNGNLLINNELGLSFEKSDLKIRGGIILEIASSLIPEIDEECIDLKGDFILPGMVNSHYHSYTNILRGTSFGEPLEIWSHDTVSLGGSLEAEDMEISTSLGICEMLRAGVTSCVDHLPHLKTASNAAEVYKASGFKVGLAPMIHNIKDQDLLYGYIKEDNKNNPFPSIDEYKDYYEDFISKFHNPHSNTQVMLGINSPQRADRELLKACSDIAHKFDLQIHSHLLESKWQSISTEGISPLRKMDEFGLVGENTSLAHCLWLNPNELDLIRDRKAMAVSNPTSNAFLGNRVFPLSEFVKRDIAIALGSDGVNCGTNNNLLEILRFFMLIQRTNEEDFEKWISLKNGYDMLTVNGSRVLNFQKPIGDIKKDSAADIVVIDKNSFLDILEESIPIQMIFHPFNTNVKHVIIDGNFVMKDKVILTIDENEIKDKLSIRKAYLRKKLRSALKSSVGQKKSTIETYKNIRRNLNDN